MSRRAGIVDASALSAGGAARGDVAIGVILVLGWAAFAFALHDELYDIFSVIASILILALSIAFYLWRAPEGREAFRLLGFFVCGQAFLSSGMGVLVAEDEERLHVMPTTEAFSFAVESTVMFAIAFMIGAMITSPRRPQRPSETETRTAGPSRGPAVFLAGLVAAYALAMVWPATATALARIGTLPLILFNPELVAPLLTATHVLTPKKMRVPLAIVLGSQVFLSFLTSLLGIAVFVIRDAFLALVMLRRPLPWRQILAVAAMLVLLSPAKHVWREAVGSSTEELTVGRSFSYWGEAISTTWDEGSSHREHPGTVETSVKRLNYNSMSAHVYTLVPNRLAFEGGATYEDIPMTMIPRFIYPDKPISSTYMRGRWIIKLGIQNRETVETTAFAVPASAEAYWNFGWLGVASVPLLLGLVVGLFLHLAPRDPAARTAFTVLAVVLLGQFLDMLVWVVPQFLAVLLSAVLIRLYCRVGKKRAPSPAQELEPSRLPVPAER